MSETFGPYRVYEALGIGGMATVHRAEIEVDGSIFEVALKCLDPEVARDRSFVRRFIAEARLGQLLRHANIARTHEVGCIEGIHFIAFEYVPGVTVLELFEHAAQTQPPPVYITLRIVTQVARALAHAHELCDEHGQRLGLIHRDVAPSNIIVAHTGAAKLIDFGVAKSTLAHVNTVVGSVIGKLGYVAPEYLKTGRLDTRADLYSLGVIAYELLTGRRLFDTERLDEAEARRLAPLAPPSRDNPHVLAELDAIVLRMLAPNPKHRYQTGTEMADALERFTTEAGLAITDADVAEWLTAELGQLPSARAPTHDTSEIAIDIDAGIEQAFARVRARTEGT